MKVLLIEPDIQLGRIYRLVLIQAGHKVLWERVAQYSIGVTDKHAPDVIILEVQLARHNGIEFLYEFRSYPDWQHIPIILNTNVATLPIKKDLLNHLGIQTVLYKPHTTLRQLVRSLSQISVSV